MWYEHIRCKECGGIIGSFDRIEYDTVFSNPKTGRLFPVITLDKS